MKSIVEFVLRPVATQHVRLKPALSGCTGECLDGELAQEKQREASTAGTLLQADVTLYDACGPRVVQIVVLWSLYM